MQPNNIGYLAKEITSLKHAILVVGTRAMIRSEIVRLALMNNSGIVSAHNGMSSCSHRIEPQPEPIIIRPVPKFPEPYIVDYSRYQGPTYGGAYNRKKPKHKKKPRR